MVSYIKVCPYPLLPRKNLKNKNTCLCQIFSCSLKIHRILGRFPYSWSHIEDKCFYKLSIPWAIYSFFILLALLIYTKLILVSLELNLNNLPVFLDSLSNSVGLIYAWYSFLQLFNNKWNYIYENILRIENDYLFCQQSRNVAKKCQKILITYILIIFLGFNVAYLLLMHYSSLKLCLKVLFYRGFQTVLALNNVYYFSSLKYFQSMFKCFENVVSHYLDYTKIHPGKGLVITHNTYEYEGSDLKFCDEKHFMPEHMKHLSKTEIIGYLRITHEDMFQTLLSTQDSGQFLAYLIFVVVNFILSGYSVLIYFIYSIDSDVAQSSLLFNVFFLLGHGVGLYWFVKSVHELNILADGLSPILMAVILRAQNNREHQELRIFRNKLCSQRKFNIYDFFEVDLQILGPLAGSILTYVLVALQFEMPLQEENLDRKNDDLN